MTRAAACLRRLQVHPMTSVEEQDELSSLLQVPLVAGTVNRGSDVVRTQVIRVPTQPERLRESWYDHDKSVRQHTLL